MNKLIVCFFIASSSLYGQSRYLDSLKLRLEETEFGSREYVLTLLDISLQYGESNPDTALVLAQQSIRICQMNDLDSLLSQAYLHAGIAYSFSARYDSSTFYCYKALEVAEKYQDIFTQADVYNNLGIDLMYQEEYEAALKLFQKTETLSRSISDQRLLGNALNNLGIIYGYWEDSQKELYYYKQAATFFKENEKREGYANALLNMGSTYTALENYSKAQIYYDSALAIYKDLNYPLALCQTYQDVCINYLKSKELVKAEQTAEEALRIANEMDSDFDKAVIYDLFRQVYESNGDIEKAYAFQERHYSLNEQIFNKEKFRQIHEIQTKYETQAKQAEIEKLTLENQLKSESLSIAKWQITALLLVICMVAFLSWFWIKRQRSERLEQELRFEALQKRYVELLNGPAHVDLNVDLESFNKKLVNPLTDREYETLKLSMSGKTKQEIAETLFVSINTVKYHVRNIYTKLGVTNKKEVLEYVVRTS